YTGLDSKPRIPVGKNFRILAWIDRDRADVEYFRRRRLGKSRRRENNKQDYEVDFSNSDSWNHPHRFRVSSLSLPLSEPAGIVLIQNSTNPSRFLCPGKPQ